MATLSVHCLWPEGSYVMSAATSTALLTKLLFILVKNWGYVLVIEQLNSSLLLNN